ncbi:MAG TPA: precorrin-4 C(11)-methyltransferase [Deltaproteobacteria bacterium]|nr:precorrin-4 C(11)-methyltransferase [Deltaproteobacteria bacterium]
MVYFIGAGPGDPELITVKGQKIIRQADLVLYAGSLVPKEVVSCAKEEARVVDSSSMTLGEIHALIVETVSSGGIVARVHTGDPSLYGATKEQMLLLDKEGIAYEVIPGVTAAFAAAAAAKVSFTVPEKCQSLIFTRLEGRTRVPETEKLEYLAKHRTSMAIYLSASDVEGLQNRLLAGGYPPDTVVVVGYRIGWPDQVVIRTQISNLAESVEKNGIRRQAVFLVLPAQEKESPSSRLYSNDFTHGFRK